MTALTHRQKASPHGDPRAAVAFPHSPPRLVHWLSFRIIDAGRRCRVTL